MWSALSSFIWSQNKDSAELVECNGAFFIDKEEMCVFGASVRRFSCGRLVPVLLSWPFLAPTCNLNMNCELIKWRSRTTTVRFHWLRVAVLVAVRRCNVEFQRHFRQLIFRRCRRFLDVCCDCCAVSWKMVSNARWNAGAWFKFLFNRQRDCFWRTGVAVASRRIAIHIRLSERRQTQSWYGSTVSLSSRRNVVFFFVSVTIFFLSLPSTNSVFSNTKRKRRTPKQQKRNWHSIWFKMKTTRLKSFFFLLVFANF